jgi:hypothetical protein
VYDIKSDTHRLQSRAATPRLARPAATPYPRRSLALSTGRGRCGRERRLRSYAVANASSKRYLATAVIRRHHTSELILATRTHGRMSMRRIASPAFRRGESAWRTHPVLNASERRD